MLSLARACRFLTLLGPAGVGKTRLAMEVARELQERSRDGAAWLDLVADRDGERFLASLASSFGFRLMARAELVVALGEHLRTSDTLIVLDNCEHLVEQAGSMITELLSRCGSLRVLATSRRPFNLSTEVTYRVPPMTIAPEGDEVPDLDGYDATKLFVERAGVRTVSDEDAAQVVSLCRRLDGIPLAIELAASRAHELSLPSLALGIAERLASVQTVVASSGHPSLEATLDWSYRALAEDEQAAMRRLAVFASSFSSQAAARVAGAHDTALAVLVERSLVAPYPSPGGRMRYRLLEAVRAFADGQLTASEREEARHQLVDHLLEVAAEAEEALRHPSQFEWLDRLDLIHDDLVAAVEWAIEEGRDADAADIVTRLLWYWIARGRAPAVRRHLEAALARSHAPAERRVDWLWSAGRLAQYEWDREAAQRFADEGARIGRPVERFDVVARCVGGLGWMRLVLEGDRAASKGLFEEAFALAQRAQDEVATAFALEGLATIPMSIGDWPDALRILSRSVALARSGGPYEVLLDDYIWLAYVLVNLGDDEPAVGTVREATALGDRIDDPFHRSSYRSLSAAIEMRRGRTEQARDLLDEADRLARLSAAPFPRMLCDAYRAFLAYHEGAGSAAELLEAAAEQGARSVVMHIAGTLYAHAAALACGRGDLTDAERLLGRARAWRAQAGGTGSAIATAESAVAEARGDPDEAAARAHVALSDAVSVSAKPSVVEALEALALALARGSAGDVAARLVGAADAARTETGWARSVLADRRRDRTLAVLEATLGPDALARETERGAALSLDAAVSYARRGRGERGRPVGGWRSLTPAELDVVRLVAQGHSNPEIAESLFVSVATVKTHLVHVYAKLGLRSRPRLIAEAVGAGAEVLSRNQPNG